MGLLVAPAAASAATACVPAALPTPPGTTGYEVAGIDGAGTVVGSVVDGTGRRVGVVWREGAVTTLDDGFVPSDVNAAGLMGGYARDPFTGRTIAALRPLDGPVRTLTASYSTWVAGVNDAGDAVGGVILEHPVSYFPAAWYAPDYPLEGFFEVTGMAATEIDDTGLAMGRADYPDTVDTVWLAEVGNGQIVRQYGPEAGVRLYDLDNGVLAATHDRRIVTIDARTGAETVVPGSTGGLPYEIDEGVVVGSVRRSAVMWRGGETVTLPAPPGTTTREATAVDGAGTRVAGMSVARDGAGVPTLWTCR
jgi:hypothetical protein